MQLTRPSRRQHVAHANPRVSGLSPPPFQITIIGLYKTEVIRRRGPWRSIDDLEFATLEWVHWFNTHRLFGPIGYIPPADHEANYYAALGQLTLPGLN